MKKFLTIGLVLAMLLVPITEAFAITQNIKTVASALACGKNATVHSSAMAAEDFTGHVGLLLVSTAGSVTITQQCSVDNVFYYDPVDPDGTALGEVTTAETVTTGKYIIPDPVMAPFIRYKIVEGDVAATAVTITVMSQRD